MRVCQRQRRHCEKPFREWLSVPPFTRAFLKSPSSRGLSAVAELLVWNLSSRQRLVVTVIGAGSIGECDRLSRLSGFWAHYNNRYLGLVRLSLLSAIQRMMKYLSTFGTVIKWHRPQTYTIIISQLSRNRPKRLFYCTIAQKTTMTKVVNCDLRQWLKRQALHADDYRFLHII